ncbi:MAG: zf-HC2 domain-containing protein [Chloroflexi bacterium]|nr:zf-HC2 domain-containing protein [Chloroflexota bacterium]
MKKHLPEEILNEYLDDVLDGLARHQVEIHLFDCVECRAQLDALHLVSSALAGLDNEPLPHNLAPAVLAKIPEQHTRLVWKLVLAAQAGIAIGMIIILLSDLLVWFQPQEWLALIFSQLASLEFPISYPSFTIPRLQAFNFQVSSTNIIFLAVSALLLWGVGNAILMNNRHEVHK